MVAEERGGEKRRGVVRGREGCKRGEKGD